MMLFIFFDQAAKGASDSGEPDAQRTGGTQVICMIIDGAKFAHFERAISENWLLISENCYYKIDISQT
jgi:hypothetical protein